MAIIKFIRILDLLIQFHSTMDKHKYIKRSDYSCEIKNLLIFDYWFCFILLTIIVLVVINHTMVHHHIRFFHIFLFCLHLLSSSLAFHRYFTFFNNQSSRQSSTFNTFHMEYWFWLLLLLLTNYHSLHTHTHKHWIYSCMHMYVCGKFDFCFFHLKTLCYHRKLSLILNCYMK